MPALQRDFLPPDLSEVLTEAGIDGAVAVQASHTVQETEWLLDLARACDAMLGVVGWLPLAEENARDSLAKLAAKRKLVGIRHVVQDEPDDRYLLREDFNRGVGHLKDFNLVYDILIFERHLPHAITFVDRHPNQVFVLDHIAKPRIKDGLLSPWRENLLDLARRDNVYCKLSGMVTEADWENWTDAGLRPYFEAALQAFGPSRLMFGSDWPVALLATSYTRWAETVRRAIGALTADEQNQILGGTAKKAYRL